LPGRVYRPSNLNGFQTPSQKLHFLRNQIAQACGVKVGFGVRLANHQVLAVLVFLCRKPARKGKWSNCCSGSDPSRGNVDQAALRPTVPLNGRRCDWPAAHPPDAIFGNQLQSLWIA